LFYCNADVGIIGNNNRETEGTLQTVRDVMSDITGKSLNDVGFYFERFLFDCEFCLRTAAFYRG